LIQNDIINLGNNITKMKKLLRIYLIEFIALWLVSSYFAGMVFEKGITTMAVASGALMVANIMIKPVVNILLLPLNLVTFGVFKWLSSAVTIYLVTLIVKDFRIEKFFHLTYSIFFCNIFDYIFVKLDYQVVYNTSHVKRLNHHSSDYFIYRNDIFDNHSNQRNRFGQGIWTIRQCSIQKKRIGGCCL